MLSLHLESQRVGMLGNFIGSEHGSLVKVGGGEAVFLVSYVECRSLITTRFAVI